MDTNPAQDVCIPIPGVKNLKITLPGMGALEFFRDSLASVPRFSTMAMQALNSTLPAIAPFYVILKIIAVIQAIQKCIMASIEAVTQLNPDPLFQCVKKLLEAIAELAKLFPPITYAAMIIDIVMLFRYMVRDCLTLLQLMDQHVSEFQDAIATGMQNNDQLAVSIGECAKKDLEEEIQPMLMVLTIISVTISAFITLLDIMAAVMPGAAPAIKDLKDKHKEMTETIDNFDLTGDGSPFKTMSEMLIVADTVLEFIVTICQAVAGGDIESLVEMETPVFTNVDAFE
jgi:hypothetical protein